MLVIKTALKSTVKVIIFFGAAVACGLTHAGDVDQPKVQAAFIYQFTNYIAWPSADDADASPFIISVVGDPTLSEALSQIAQTKKVKNRPIQIHSVHDVAELKKSHVVFVGLGDAGVKEVAKKSRGWSALIISSGDGLATKGAMISFFLENGRLRFEISQSALESESLKANSQLLKLAKIVE